MIYKKGKFFVIYGSNNLGKSTLSKGIAHYLEWAGFPVKYLKYPIYSLKPTGPQINAYLRKGNPKKLTMFAAQKIYAQNRRDFEPELIETLNKGINVVAEDYKGTGIAWGMTKNVSQELLEKINSNLLDPDLAILVDGDRFNSGIESNHTHESFSELWKLNRQIHLKLTKRYNWKIINANKPIRKVLQDALLYILPLLKNRFV